VFLKILQCTYHTLHRCSPPAAQPPAHSARSSASQHLTALARRCNWSIRAADSSSSDRTSKFTASTLTPGLHRYSAQQQCLAHIFISCDLAQRFQCLHSYRRILILARGFHIAFRMSASRTRTSMLPRNPAATRIKSVTVRHHIRQHVPYIVIIQASRQSDRLFRAQLHLQRSGAASALGEN